MGCVGSPTDVHRGMRRTVAPPGRRLTVGRGVALPLSVPLPSLGRQQSGRHWRCAVHGGRGPPYHSGSCSPSFSGYDLCGVGSVRRRGPACSSRPPCGPAAGAGGRVTLRLPSRVGGAHPPCLGGVVAPFRAAACGTPFWLSSCCWRAPFRRARAVGAEVPPRGGGGEGRPVDRSPGGPQLTCKPPLCPLGVGCGYGRVMRGAASFVFRRACCSGTPVWVRGSRSSRRCPYRVAVPPVGGGAPPALGGRRAAPVAPQLGWVRGGGGGGAPPRPLSGLCGRGGGSGGGPSVPWRCLLSAKGGGGGGLAVPAPGASHRPGGSRPSPAPLYRVPDPHAVPLWGPSSPGRCRAALAGRGWPCGSAVSG